ncbi:hypothetical protein M9194_09100 [Vibrio sp. S4M6]|uniref:LptA/OstA family protein n=1 Tax=Vibrio sinus TaxID=2946865 RepID=UPI002029CFA0|nr:LptA/OstA family protein [Vibrio sinus]MCL9781581.1 hypothetical protein [Vibrio sinus]
MKKLLNLPILCTAMATVFLASPVFALKIDADKIDNIMSYQGDVRVTVSPNEKVMISSDSIQQSKNGYTTYDGNVVIKIDEMTMKANKIKVQKRKDGAFIITTDKLVQSKS